MSKQEGTERKEAPGADDDLDTVSRCRRGEVEAYEILVEKYQKKMLNLSYRLIGDYEEACEAVQDAFLSAYRSLKNFRGEARFSTWLYRIVVNHSKNRLQQVKTRDHREVYSLQDPGGTEEGARPPDPPDPNPSALEKLEQDERDAKVQGCIGGLASEYREVLILRDLQGFSYDEIGDILKIPGGTVKSRLFRARESLKECLKRALGGL